MIRRIISGAQTGADRAALDVAMRRGIEWGGWIPKGRFDENGIIPAHYRNLVEVEDDQPETRTEHNILHSDATLILSHGSLFGGSAYTQLKAEEWGKPYQHIDLSQVTVSEAVQRIRLWLEQVRPQVLNVAGPRASDDPLIYDKTCQILDSLRDGFFLDAPVPLLTVPAYWHDALSYLSRQDEVLAQLIAAYPDTTLLNHHNPFSTLMRAIVGQQISVKAADAIWLRLESLLPSLSAKDYLSLSEEALRDGGLSRQKIAYISHVAVAFEQGILHPPDWPTMDDQAVVKQLTTIKGIGLWTAQMFLIFHLHRPDVLPLADLGLINAIHHHYGQGQKLTKAEILDLSQRWQPYRTVATWFLWRSLDPVVVQY